MTHTCNASEIDLRDLLEKTKKNIQKWTIPSIRRISHFKDTKNISRYKSTFYQGLEIAILVDKKQKIELVNISDCCQIPPAEDDGMLLALADILKI